MFTTTHKRGNIFRGGFHVACVRQLTSDDAETKKHRCNTYDNVESSFASCGLELFRHELVLGIWEWMAAMKDWMMTSKVASIIARGLLTRTTFTRCKTQHSQEPSTKVFTALTVKDMEKLETEGKQLKKISKERKRLKEIMKRL
jgi:hypothetical protein